MLHVLLTVISCLYSSFQQKFTQPIVIEQMAYVLIACGILMFVLSFLGYVGAIRESSCMLSTVSSQTVKQSNSQTVELWAVKILE